MNVGGPNDELITHRLVHERGLYSKWVITVISRVGVRLTLTVLKPQAQSVVQTGKARQRYTTEHGNQQTHVMAHCILRAAASPQTEYKHLNIFILRDGGGELLALVRCQC